MTIIDNITQTHGASDITFDHTVTSQDCVLVVSLGNHQGGPLSPGDVQYNGSNLIKLATSSTAFNETAEIWIMTNPPVGTYPLFVRNVGGASGSFAAAMSIRGIAKNFSSVPNGATNGTSTQPAVTLNPGFGDCFIIDCYYSEADGGNTRQEQTQWANQQGQSFENGGSSYRYIGSGPETVDMRWVLSSSQRWAQVVVALPVNKAYSIADPSISIKNIRDVNVQDTQYQNATAKLGYQPSTFYQNSFLHTVGRSFGANTGGPYGILSSANIQSGIIIDHIAVNAAANAYTGSIEVSSLDAVVVVISISNNIGGSVALNGQAMVKLSSFTIVSGGTTKLFTIWYTKNPPVGMSTITSLGSGYYTAMSLLGVFKEDSPTIFTNTGNIDTASVSIYPAVNNSLVIDGFLALQPSGSTVSNISPGSNQIQIYSTSIGSSSYAIVNSNEQTLTWKLNNAQGTNTMQWGIQAVVFKPLHANSIAFPSIRSRNVQDIIKAYGIDNGINISSFEANYNGYPAQFYQNSFLHTVGRQLGQFIQPIATLTSETEQETSQIIIDKVFQGQIPAQALSQVSLTMDISIPSPDAVLVVTGGSVIATGAKWASVQFNGNPLTNLIQASVAGADAEIWYYPFPPVGVGQLTITSGTGGEIYANAMVLLGVDKRSTNIMTASSTDAASTSIIGALITPDAPNSLVIDTLAALDATASPVWDSSQTQVFNATALASSEYVLSTYKLASTQQNMNYNLSAAVNAALVAVAFRPAQAPSQWFPNIDFRQLDDTVTSAGLDAEINPSFGQYGYKPTTFYKNSFLHTMGRIVQPQVLDPTGPLTAGLISYWKFDENAGTVLNDEMHSNPGIWTGTLTTIWKTDGKVNSAGIFNGNDNYVIVARNPLLGGLINSSVSLWIKMTFSSEAAVFYEERSTSGNDLWRVEFTQTTNGVRFSYRDDAGTLTQLSGNIQVIDNQWHHIVITKTSKTIKSYIDGVLDINSTVTGTDNFTNANILTVFGNDVVGAGEFYTGLLDEAGVWNRSLSSYEVSNLYNLGKGLQFPFLPNSNTVNFGAQGYSYYNEGLNAKAERNWQSSFLQTVGRNIPFSPASTKFSSTLMMMGVG